MLKIIFKIKNIVFRDEKSKYTIVNIKVKETNVPFEKQEITLKGYFINLFVGDEFSSMVELKEDDYGEYLNSLIVPEVVLPENKSSLAKFISNRVDGLSKKKALEIVENLGLNALSIIEEDYKPLLKIDKITEKKAKSIQRQLVKHISFEELALFIQSLALPIKECIKIYSLYGDESLNIIKSNPYSICFNNLVSFKIADIIANKLSYNGLDEKRLMVGILDYINYNKEGKGHVFVTKTDLISNLKNHLNSNGVIKLDELRSDTIEDMILKLNLTKSIVVEKNYDEEELIYGFYENYLENDIVRKIKNIVNAKKQPFCTSKEIDDYIKIYEKDYFTLAKEQKKSIYMCLLNNISILTGGPGTGKTNTTSAIVKCINHINPYATITLLAPTGRASQRIKELTSLNASTIHKGLHIKPFYSKDDDFEILSDYVVVDESSMIDIYLFHKLISSISENTRLLLVGDVNQLPSVGAGNILRDMIDSETISVTKLTKVFRQAEKSTIVSNAHKIINNQKTIDKNGFDVSNKKENNFKFWKETDIYKIKEKVEMSIDKLINTYHYKLEDITILSPMKKGSLGTKELNRLIQKKYNPSSPTKSEYEIDSLNLFREGDKVIQNINNYDLKVFNGDIGYIEKIYTVIENGVEVEKMDIDFNGNYATYSVYQFQELDLAYAITTHKSQGSEFKVVVTLIHPVFNNMLNRSILYTAITRAKEMCIMIGDIFTLNDAIENVDIMNRNSSLKEKLIKIS